MKAERQPTAPPETPPSPMTQPGAVGCSLQRVVRLRRKRTWGSIYRNSLRRGDDHGYAAMLADQWEKRQEKICKKADGK